MNEGRLVKTQPAFLFGVPDVKATAWLYRCKKTEIALKELGLSRFDMA
jgi:hypothetical protein